ncbi:OTUD4 [Mytilus coruscus]|uniref:OTUD4 n=1 Tax=Mytilus coruscus TaxID=42192 RepID=A0A6J8ENQ9_MYTCO|nr:OTUD4 [Mytilus coruscus]
MAGASQNQWFEVTGVSVCIFGQEPKIQTNYELSDSHKPLNTCEFRLSEILETGNKVELPKTQENIYPELLKLNVCSNATMKINQVHVNNFIISPPTACKTITGDENCLFRAISYSLSNRQEYFGDIRRAIVDHLMRNAEVFKSFLQPRFKTAEEHIQTHRMEENNVWGTELEILACADLIKTDIYTFYKNSWIKYSSSQICSNNYVNDQAIYLQHNGDINHYEVVTAVTQKSFAPNGLQSRQEHEKKYEISRKSEVTKKKLKIDENQMTISLNNTEMDICNTESKILSKNEKERIRYTT